MLQELWLTICLLIDLIASVLITIVFCFWFAYLLEAIRQKRNCYNSAMRCSLRDSHQFAIAYNTKTELVKYVFLSFMNLIEWIAFICVRVASMLELVAAQTPQIDNRNHNQSQLFKLSEHSHYRIGGNTTEREFQLISFIIFNFHILGKNCIVLSLALIASMCMYLSARYAHVSWIKSNRTYHLICIFVLYLVVNQVIALFSTIVARWLNTLLFTLSVIIAIQKVRELTMIINWSIVDLRVSQNNKILLERYVRMKGSFNRMMSLLSLGVILLLLTEYMENISLTLEILLRGSICLTVPPLLKNIIKIFSIVDYITSFMGTACIFLPYLVYGCFTFYAILWRLVRGKTGYTTHFSGHTY